MLTEVLHNESTTINKLIYILIAFFFLIISIAISYISIYLSITKKKKRIIEYLNSFKSGVGLSLSLFIILPYSQESISLYTHTSDGDDKYNHIISDFGWSFLMLVIGYFISLLFLKLILDFEIEKKVHFEVENKENEIDRISQISDLSETREKQEERNTIKDDEEDEENFKVVMTAKGRFGTFIGINNLNKSISSDEHLVIKNNKSVIETAILVNKSYGLIKKEVNEIKKSDEEDKDNDLFVKPENNKNHNSYHEAIINTNTNIDNQGFFKDRKLLFIYLNISFIGLQGFFIGGFIGSVSEELELIIYSIIFLVYKNIEMICFCNTVKNSSLEIVELKRFIIILIVFIPFGILIISLFNINLFLIGILNSILSGILIYQSTSESIIEEFTFTHKRFLKFTFFFLGAICVGLCQCLLKLKDDLN